MKLVYISKEYVETPNAQICKLNKQGIEDYLKDQKQFKSIAPWSYYKRK